MNNIRLSFSRRWLLRFFAAAALSIRRANALAEPPVKDEPGALPNRGQISLDGHRYGIETPQQPHNIRIFQRQGRSPIIRFELRPGESRESERGVRERVEFRSRVEPPIGATRWYSGAFRIGDFLPDGNFNILVQWHSAVSILVPPTGVGPWLRFQLSRGQAGKLEIGHRGSDEDGRKRPLELTMIDVTPFEWYNFVVEARTSLTDGLLRVWINGRKVLDWAGGPLGDWYKDSRIAPTMGAMKFGIYRWARRADGEPVRSTAKVWFTNIEQGEDLSDRVRNPLQLPSPRDFE